MTTQHDDDEDGPGPASRHHALIGLLLLAGLVVAVLFVVHELQESARMQDCLASGRTNCAPIAIPGR
jgi:hypothetical protein